MRLPFALALAALLAASATMAASRPCGDDVDGRAVPCDCGDVLVSGRTLGNEDPVTQHPCDGTGLVVDIRGDGSPVLELAGRALEGRGWGAGIQVVHGGTGGLRVRGPGAVRGFAIGLQALHGALAAATDVLAAENTRDGFDVIGIGYAITGCEAVNNGHEGFVLRGRDYRADGNRALENGRSGFAVSGRQATLGGEAGNEAAGNARDGATVHGRQHAVLGLTATGNRRQGVRAHGARGRIVGTIASAHGRRAIRVTGSGATIVGGSTSQPR